MAKELPYFKFFVSEWNDGDITLEDYEVQGLFINVCSYYWSKDCDISEIKLRKRFKGCDDSIDALIDSDIIRIEEDGGVNIKFLLEQLNDRGVQSNKNSNAAKIRWERKRDEERKECERNANALSLQCESDAIKRREEKKREDKEAHSDESEDKSLSVEESFSLFWDRFHELTEKPKKERAAALKYWKKLNLTDQRKAYSRLLPFSKSNTDKDYLPYARTYLSGRSFDDEFTVAARKPKGKETYEQIVSRTAVNKRYNF